MQAKAPARPRAPPGALPPGPGPRARLRSAAPRATSPRGGSARSTRGGGQSVRVGTCPTSTRLTPATGAQLSLLVTVSETSSCKVGVGWRKSSETGDCQRRAFLLWARQGSHASSHLI